VLLQTQDHALPSGGRAVPVGQAGKTVVCTVPDDPHYPFHSPVGINFITLSVFLTAFCLQNSDDDITPV